jgi:hypothetical protein
MNKNWGEVTGVDPDKLYKLFQILDDIGVYHEWSMDNGELHIRAGDVWISFLADQQIIRNDEDAYADAQRVADMYWRE